MGEVKQVILNMKKILSLSLATSVLAILSIYRAGQMLRSTAKIKTQDNR